MDDLIMEFVAEAGESLSVLDQELVRFEQNPGDRALLNNIFRLMHTIKGTCGFLGLPRLEKVAHAGEDVLGKFRDGELAPSAEAVSLILRCIDQIRTIVDHLAGHGAEPAGDDAELIGALRLMASDDAPAPAVAEVVGDGAPVLSDQGFPVAAEFLAECEAVSAASPPPAEPAPAPVLASVKPSSPESEPAPVAEAREKAAPQSIRVNVEVIEELMTMVSEMVLTRNQLLQLARQHDDSVFKEPIQRLSRVTTELQEGVMKTRMQPIGNAWSKLTRIVRDLANELGKQIALDMHGEETELDRQVLELIRDPLTHMVRNSADHGLESPAEREAAGKPASGTIRLSAFHEGGHIIIQIADDGRGLDVDRIRRKILEKGLASADALAAMSDEQIQQYIMKPGFSTAEKVTNVSGRGVGMDVVRSNIEKIGGTLQFRSTRGHGSTFTIKIPLTLAIVSALIVRCGGDRFAVPQLAVQEVVRVAEGGEHRLESLKGAPVLRLRHRLLPLVDLSAVFQLPADDRVAGEAPFRGYVVVCRAGNQYFGLMVDAIADNEEIVVKPLSRLVKSVPYYSGNTILGDGSVILILDPNSLASSLSASTHQAAAESANAVAAADATESLLLFRSGTAVHAVPLSQVQRIEHVADAAVETVQGHPVLQYRGYLMPLVGCDGDYASSPKGRRPVLVFGSDDRPVGLGIDEIVDIVQDKLSITRPASRRGVLGSAIVQGRAVDVVDVAHYCNPAAVSQPIEMGVAA
jgi:two-component system chemotaxis sensor kinase CheA